ncbi:hypothetical protein GCM10014719_48090 [Planomonospora parontospora subsp. antibiotica]|nr:hypothetical protein GCM10014719_48090 [Planomonospora parontospora subsp. antibiotica]GII17938.1 hypothetical protein Ppa05_46640 [Planomonospora parontospora subsp. antibiotica]
MPRPYDAAHAATARELQARTGGRWAIMWGPWSGRFTAWYLCDPDDCPTVHDRTLEGLWDRMVRAEDDLWQARMLPTARLRPTTPIRPVTGACQITPRGLGSDHSVKGSAVPQHRRRSRRGRGQASSVSADHHAGA